MTFRIVDLIARLDATRQRAYRMCDASGEPPCPNSQATPGDTTIDDGDNGDAAASPSGRRDYGGRRDQGQHDGCGPGKPSLSLLRDELRRSLHEPPASPW